MNVCGISFNSQPTYSLPSGDHFYFSVFTWWPLSETGFTGWLNFRWYYVSIQSFIMWLKLTKFTCAVTVIFSQKIKYLGKKYFFSVSCQVNKVRWLVNISGRHFKLIIGSRDLFINIKIWKYQIRKYKANPMFKASI